MNIERNLSSLFYKRLEEINRKMAKQVPEYEKAKSKIEKGYELIKEKNPELYHAAVIEKIDEAVGDIESSIRLYFYWQGIEDALRLKEFLRETD